MKEEEAKLWQIVDIKGYAAFSSSSFLTLKIIARKFEKIEHYMKNWERILRHWAGINDSCKKIIGRFQKMDLSLMDDRFPVEVLRELKEDVMPKMGQEYDELDSMLNKYASDSPPEERDIIQKIDECKETVERMLALGEQIRNDKRYRQYRNATPELERIHYSNPVD